MSMLRRSALAVSTMICLLYVIVFCVLSSPWTNDEPKDVSQESKNEMIQCPSLGRAGAPSVSSELSESIPTAEKQTIYILQTSGMGSQLVNMLAHKVYFNDEGQNFMVDTSTYGYRWNASLGLLTGYFLQTFPVIDNPSQYPEISDQYGISNYSDLRRQHSPLEEIQNRSSSIIVTPLQAETRKAIFTNYDTRSVPFYNRMAFEACSALQFNDRALSEIEKIKRDYNLPNFRQGGTVAFHVRRGDKLIRESKLYPGSVYVDKLLNMTSAPIDHCFIASGDYRAVEEVTAALHERRVNCTIHTITSESEDGADDAVKHSDRTDTI